MYHLHLHKLLGNITSARNVLPLGKSTIDINKGLGGTAHVIVDPIEEVYELGYS